MKKTKLVSLITVLVVILTGCSLAKNEAERNPLVDDFVGALIVFDDGTENEIEAYEDLIEVEVEKKDGEKYTKVNEINGHAVIVDKFKVGSREDDYVIETVLDKYIENIHIEIEVNDTETISNAEIKIYGNVENTSNLAAYPIYKSKTGKYYAEMKVSGGSMTSDEIHIGERELGTIYVKDRYEGKSSKDSRVNIIAVSGAVIKKGTEVNFLGMDKENKLINKQSLKNIDIPKTIKVNENTEYIVVEQLENQEYTKRTLVNLEGDEPYISLPVFTDSNIAEMRFIEFEK